MAKGLKRAGIVFFTLVVSFLLIVSCATINSTDNFNVTTTNSDSENEVIEVNEQNAQNTLIAQNADYVLKGDCSQIAEIWTSALLDSYNNKRVVKIVMESDWIAEYIDDDCVTAFGSAYGFDGGKIYVPQGVNVILDLNGHTIDRNLFNAEGAPYAYCMLIQGFASIIDSSYDSNEVYKLLAQNKLTQANVDNLPFGKIRGGNNTSNGYYASGIRVSEGGSLNFYSGIICNNKAMDAAGLTAMRNGYINFYDGLIFGNVSTHHGAGVCSGIESTVVMRGGIVANNTSTTGAGLFTYSVSSLDLRNIIVTNNHGTSISSTSLNEISLGAGAYITDGCKIKIGLGVQIFGNLCDNKENNLYLQGDTNTAQISTSYITAANLTAKHITNVGISLDSPRIFTDFYSIYNGSTNPVLFFFSDNLSYSVVKNGQEVEVTSVASTAQTLTWKYNNSSTTSRFAVVTYTGEPFTISATGNIYWFAHSSKPSYSVTNVGVYAFCSSTAYKNSVFTFIILPKEVDLEWDTNLIYNGQEQTPTAKIKTGQLVAEDECEVNVLGSATNVGKGYFAEARSLNNTNYKINPASKNTTFNINSANLQVTATTNNSVADYNGKEIKLPNNWYKLSAELLGQDSGKSLDSIFDIDYSKIIPQFTKDSITSDSAVNVGEYAISVKPFNVNEVFSGNNNYNVVINYVNGGTLSITESQVIRPSVESQYEYLVLEDDKRVAYSEKELVHGENDSNVNMSNGKANYYLGNIAPNTSVNKFISNLVYDKTQIQIYNNKDEIIYNKGNAEVSAELLDNGIELAIGTGWYIEYVVGSETEKITLSVLGDINGDGRISAKDVATLREIANNKAVYESLSVEQKLASMIVNKGGVTTADSEIVRNVIDKLFDINLFF